MGKSETAKMFAKLGVLLLEAKKFAILVLAAIAGFVRKLFGKGKDKTGGTVS